jgi:type 2 lantibiotic biosynthesis protein LanM
MLLEIKAETVDECLAILSNTNGSESTNESVRLTRRSVWEEGLRTDSRGTLLRRIQSEGWESHTFMEAIGSLPSRTVGGGWTRDLNWVIGEVQRPASYDEEGLETVQPFGQLLWPLCESASSRLKRTLTHGAFGALKENLLARLCTYAAPALYHEFVIFREGFHPTMSHHDNGKSIYVSFIAKMRNGFFQTLLRQRPALARLIVNLLRQWISATNEFVDCLASDQQSLSQLIKSPCAIGDLVSIETNLSDFHNDGRSVLLLTFASGARVLYKPRSLACDSIWNLLTSWLAANGCPIIIGRQPTSLDMGHYGWQSLCEHSYCPSASASTFYQRIGACLALFRVLGASDMHHENLIANGDHPVFVDLETLVSPLPRIDFSTHSALRAAEQTLLRSVWRTGILPDAMLLPTRDVMTYGALAESPKVTGSIWGFINANTDRMRFLPRQRRKLRFKNLPRDEQEAFPPSAYVEDIQRGYEETIHLVRNRWDEFWYSTGLMASLSGAPIRAIFRPTAVYASLLHRLRNPKMFTSGVLWSSQLELDQGNPDQLGVLATAPLMLAERSALVNGDVPYFLTTVGETTVRDCSDVAVPDAVEAIQLRETAQAVVDDEDIHRDLQLIAWSLASQELPPTPPWPNFDQKSIDDDTSLLAAEAERLFNILERRAVIAEDGVAWWGRKSLLKAPTIGVLGIGLYDGLTGIAVFLAAMASVLQNDSARELTERTVSTVEAMVLAHRPSRLRPGQSLGMAFGMAGVAYGLAMVSRLLNEPHWLEIARDAACWITPEVIQSDQTFDVMDGSAGAIIALLRLWESTDDERWLRSAVLCGSHLLEIHRDKHQWWTMPSRRIQTGMAHGLAGIGLALCRLSKIAGKEFADTALAALRLIDRSYDADFLDWSSEIVEDSDKSNRNFWCRWCHGALGVGLAWRELVSDANAAPDAANSLSRAKRGALENATRPADTLCCGNFGNIDYLLEVSDNKGPLRSVARSRAAWRIRETRRKGSYEFDGADDEANLGLFPGISGIGYVILRTLVPERLPSLLAFRL